MKKFTHMTHWIAILKPTGENFGKYLYIGLRNHSVKKFISCYFTVNKV